MKRLLIALFLSFTSVALPSPANEMWSEVVNGIRGRLIISFDPDFVGTEMAVVALEIQNVSDVGTPKEIWFDPDHSLAEWSLRDGNGKVLPKQGAAASIMMTGPYWITLPHDSTLRFRVSVSGYGIRQNGGIAFQLPGAFWQVPRRSEGSYELSAIFSSSPPTSDPRRSWLGKLSLPAVKVPGKKENAEPLSPAGAGRG